MKRFLNPVAGACLIALSGGLVLVPATRPAQAQTPPVAPAPAAPAVAVPRPPSPVANAVTVTPPRLATPNVNAYAMRPQARVYTVPAQGTPTVRHPLHYGYWPARRDLPLAKPWLKHD